MKHAIERSFPESFSARTPAIVALLVLASTQAAQDVGFEEDSDTSGNPNTPTESKPQSKLWHHDGKWWGCLWSSSASAFRIHVLDTANHEWDDTGVPVGGPPPPHPENGVETRDDSHSDVLSDGTKLYIVSHEFVTNGSKAGHPIVFSSYTYNTTLDTYSIDATPVIIGNVSTESVTIDKDSEGTIWAAWTEHLNLVPPESMSRVHVNHSLSSPLVWGTRFMLPTSTTDLNIDDLCALTRFKDDEGEKIGILWSDQSDQANHFNWRYRFSWHLDGNPDTTWSAIQNLPVDSSVNGDADDHINFATHFPTKSVFVAGKNADDDILLLVRSGNGTWNRHRAWEDTGPQFTRPIVVLRTSKITTIPPPPFPGLEIHMFAANRDLGGIFHKVPTSMSPITFNEPAHGTQVMFDSGTPIRINDPTSTKQNYTALTGLVVLAYHTGTLTYWHHEQ